jgi:hypothetical protein
MYIYTFLLGMTDTMTSQNIDLSSWDTLYRPKGVGTDNCSDCWLVTRCSLASEHRRIWATCYPHLQGWIVWGKKWVLWAVFQFTVPVAPGRCPVPPPPMWLSDPPFLAACLHNSNDSSAYTLNPEDGGSGFLRNVGIDLQRHTVSKSTRLPFPMLGSVTDRLFLINDSVFYAVRDWV